MPDKKSILKCRHCSKSFKYDSERKRHEQSHDPQFQCKVCNKNFSFISALRRHEKQHERTGTVQCSECGREFRDNILLKRHTKYAHGGKFTCTKCSTVFNSEPALKTHMKTHKSLSERRYECSFEGCTKKFNFAHHLKHHELTHTNTKQHYCKICNKGFIQSHHLKTHMKTHTSDSSLICLFDDCGKKFATVYAKKRHVVKHHLKPDSGISSDSSSACDLSFMTKKETEDDTINCPSCAQIILKSQYEKHAFSCIQNLKEEYSTENIPGTIFENSGIEELRTQSRNNDEEVVNCKLVLGRCIMSDKGEKCVCAQISKTVEEEEYDFVPIDEPLNMTKPDKNTDNFCEGCECSERFKVKTAPIRPCGDWRENAPLIEYKTDGTLKLKEFFEIDIPTLNSPIEEKNTYKEVKLFPYNSCKAVLGNCIVSGNGTMGDGCLCARMAMDDQITTQEIDDITPRPKQEMCL
nr:zinc finger protein 14 [Helicoverpa armigera]